MAISVGYFNDNRIIISPIYYRFHGQKAASASSHWAHRIDDHSENFGRIARPRLIVNPRVARWRIGGALGKSGAAGRGALDECVARDQPVACAGDQHEIADDILIEDTVEDLVGRTRAIRGRRL